MNRVLFALMGLIGVVAVGTGLFVFGGPGTARAEREDQDRLMAVNDLARAISCAYDTAVLPEAIGVTSFSDACRPTNLRVSASQLMAGGLLTYRRLSDHRFQICVIVHDLGRSLNSAPYSDMTAGPEGAACLTRDMQG